MFSLLTPYKLLIELGLIVVLLGGLSVYSYNSGYTHATDKANARQSLISSSANIALEAKNAEVLKINKSLAAITQKMELKTHEYQTKVNDDRIAINPIKRLRDPYTKPPSDCELPINTNTTKPAINTPTQGELSEEFTDFLKQQTLAADEVATYARICHEWVIEVSSSK